MKFIKQFLCLALAVLMLFTVVACDGGSTGGGGGGGGGGNNAVTTTENRYDDLPDIDMDGKEMKIYSVVQQVNANSFEAERDGDVINNAVYDRNANLESRLNCYVKVTEVVNGGTESTMYDEMTKLQGQAMYNMVTCATYLIVRLAVEGFLVDLASQEFVDLDKDYYDDGYNEALNAGGRQYLVSGKLSISWYRYQIVCLFNRNMFKKALLEPDDYYQIVLDGHGARGGWTTSKMMEVAQEMYADTGTAAGVDKDDQFGYYLFTGSGSSQTDGFMGAWNLRLIEKTADGYYMKDDAYEPTPWVEAINTFLDTAGFGAYLSSDLSNDLVVKKFTDQEAGMITFRLYTVESDEMVTLSRDGYGYGILPLPKANEDQENYVSYVQDQVLSFGIPRTMTGNDRVLSGQFLEAFASEAYNTTMPAYYERALTAKYVVDGPSKAMLQIIDSNIVVDPVNVYYGQYFNFTTGTLRVAFAKQKNITELLSAAIAGGAFDAKVETLNAALKELDAELTAAGE